MKLSKNLKRFGVERICRVENLNPEKGIVSALTKSKSRGKYYVCLCLGYKNVKTGFPTRNAALEAMQNARKLYSKISSEE